MATHDHFLTAHDNRSQRHAVIAVICRVLVGTDFFGGTNFGGTAIRREFLGGKRFSFFWRDRFRRFPVPHFLAVLSSAVRGMAGPPSAVPGAAFFGGTLVGGSQYGGTAFGGSQCGGTASGGSRLYEIRRYWVKLTTPSPEMAVLSALTSIFICTIFVYLHIFVAAERAASRFSVVSLLSSIVPDRKMTNDNCFKIGTERTTPVPRKRINDKKAKKTEKTKTKQKSSNRTEKNKKQKTKNKK